MQRHRNWLWGAAGLVAVGVAVAVPRMGKAPAPRYESVAVERGPVVAKVTATGVLSALVTVQVGSQVSGRLKSVDADFNSSVGKNQVIAQIDPELFNAAREQAHANAVQAQAQLQQAKVKAMDAGRIRKRDEALRAKNLIAQADADTAAANADAADAAVVAAEANLEQARAALHQAQVNLDYCTIRSPISGTVISRSVDPGQTVAASFQAPTLFTIAEDLRRMQVDTSVAEADVGRLLPGMVATFVVDAYPSERFTGHIRQIRNAPQTVQNVVTYDAVIDVENPELKLKPGMTANVTVLYAQRQDALRIPNAALRFRPTQEMLGRSDSEGAHRHAGGGGGGRPGAGEGAQKTVWVLKGGKPAPVKVSLGVTDGTVTEVLGDGLHEGDTVVVSALDGTGGAAPAGGPPALRRMF